MFVDAMNLKHVLRQVQAYPNDLQDDSPSLQFTSDIGPGWEGGVGFNTMRQDGKAPKNSNIFARLIRLRIITAPSTK